MFSVASGGPTDSMPYQPAPRSTPSSTSPSAAWAGLVVKRMRALATVESTKRTWHCDVASML
jgi:hypothetical protein